MRIVSVITLVIATHLLAAEPYKLGSDSESQDGVPKGEVTKFHWKSEKFYPGTERDFWIYVPKQYDKSKPACLMVFQDGAGYLGKDVQAPIVFDNLISKKEIPVTISLFINPGKASSTATTQEAKRQRSIEYDTLS